MHWFLGLKISTRSKNLALTRLPICHLFCQCPSSPPTHLRAPKKENRTRIDVKIIDISSQLGRIPIRHTRAPNCIQIINIQIRRLSGVVDEDGGLALGIGGLGGTACGERMVRWKV